MEKQKKSNTESKKTTPRQMRTPTAPSIEASNTSNSAGETFLSQSSHREAVQAPPMSATKLSYDTPKKGIGKIQHSNSNVQANQRIAIQASESVFHTPSRKEDSHSNPNPSSTRTDEAVRQCISDVLEASNYVTSEALITRYRKVINNDASQLGKLDSVRYLRDVNIEVNCAVDGYYYSTPVKLVFDCEQWVLKQVNLWLKNAKKLPVVERFEDLGIGGFLYNPYVCAKFGYRPLDIPSIPRVQLEDIMNVYLDILASSANQASISNDHLSRRNSRGSASKTLSVPSNKIGLICGPLGANVRLIQDLTGTAINIKSNAIKIVGPDDAVEKACDLVQKVVEEGAGILKQPYQDRFEQRLRFVLQSKFNIESLTSLGVVIDARGMHMRLIQHTQDYSKAFKEKAISYGSSLSSAVEKRWKEWLAKRRNELSQSQMFKNSMDKDVLSVINNLDSALLHNSSPSLKSSLFDLVCSGDYEHMGPYFDELHDDNHFWGDASKTVAFTPDKFSSFLQSSFSLLPILARLLAEYDPQPMVDLFASDAPATMQLRLTNIVKETTKCLKFKMQVGITLEAFQLISSSLTVADMTKIVGAKEVVVSLNNKQEVVVTYVNMGHYTSKLRKFNVFRIESEDPGDMKFLSTDDETIFIDMFQDDGPFDLLDSVVVVLCNFTEDAWSVSGEVVETLQKACKIPFSKIELLSMQSKLIFGVIDAPVLVADYFPTPETRQKLVVCPKANVCALLAAHILAYRVISLYLGKPVRGSRGPVFEELLALSKRDEVAVRHDVNSIVKLEDVLDVAIGRLCGLEDYLLKRFDVKSAEELQQGSFSCMLMKVARQLMRNIFGESVLENLFVCDQVKLWSMIEDAQQSSTTAAASTIGVENYVREVDPDVLAKELHCIFDAHLSDESYLVTSLDGWFEMLLDMEVNLLKRDDEVPTTALSVNGRAQSLLEILSNVLRIDDELSGKLRALFSTSLQIGEHNSENNASIDEQPSLYQSDIHTLYQLCYAQLSEVFVGPDEVKELAVQKLLSRSSSAIPTESSALRNAVPIDYSNVVPKKLEHSLCFAIDVLASSIETEQAASDLNGQATTFAFSPENKKALAKLLTELPVGACCSQAMNWTYVQHAYGLRRSAPEACIPLLLQHLHAELMEANPNCRFFIFSADDAVVLPDKLPTIKAITEALYSTNVFTVWAWMLRAQTLSESARTQFYANVAAAFDEDSIVAMYGDSSNAAVADWALRIAQCSPLILRASSLQVWIAEVMTVVLGRVSAQYGEDYFLRHISTLERDADYVSAVTLLLQIVENCEASNVLSHLREWARKTANPYHRVVVPTVDSQGRTGVDGDEVSNPTSDVNVETTSANAVDAVTLNGTLPNEDEATRMKSKDTTLAQCRQEIERIYDSEDVQASFRGSFQNAVKLLSKINSRDVHFVLEVIQNAADNSYAEDVKPTLVIDLNPRKVVVKSNERGFLLENVHAICSVGKSHKKNTIGFIGHKGIGFKTVFAVSDAPEIHSNGFHFCFDKPKGSLLAPYWIEDTGDSWPNIHDTNFPTHIVLPLNEDAKRNLEKLRENLQLVFDKNLLLFLKKLSVMILNDFSCHPPLYKRLERVSLFHNWVLCRQEDAVAVVDDIWYMKKAQFTPTVPRGDEDLKDIARTEVCVALKFAEVIPDLSHLPEGGDEVVHAVNSKTTIQLMVQKEWTPLYSFLPTRMTAFRFILQADFVLVTNRESIEENHAYNRQLLVEATTLLVSVFDELLNFAQCQSNKQGVSSEAAAAIIDEPTEGLTEICDKHELLISPSSIIDLIPRPDDTTSESLKQVALAVCDQLKDKPLFQNCDGDFVCAAQIISADHLPTSLVEVVPPRLLERLLGRKFPHPSLDLDKEMIRQFKMTTLTSQTIVDCLVIFHERVVPDETIAHEEKVYMVRDLLKALYYIVEHEVNVASNKMGSQQQHNKLARLPALTMKPRNVALLSVTTDHQPSTNKSIRTLNAEHLKRLRGLQIWPLSNGHFVRIANGLPIFASDPRTDGSNETMNHMHNCLATNLATTIQVLDPKIIESYATRFEFIISNFKADKGKEGIVVLSPDKLISNIILPLLQDRSVTPSTEATISMLTLVLAHQLHGSKTRAIFEKGLWVPVMTVKEHNTLKDTAISSRDSLRVVFLDPIDSSSYLSSTEVHFGPEFTDEATAKLGFVSTAMRQTEWLILSPHISARLAAPGNPNVPWDGDGLLRCLTRFDNYGKLKDLLKKIGITSLWKVSKENVTMMALEKILKQLLGGVVPLKDASIFTFPASKPLVEAPDKFIFDAMKTLWNLILIEFKSVGNHTIKAAILSCLKEYSCVPIASMPLTRMSSVVRQTEQRLAMGTLDTVYYSGNSTANGHGNDSESWPPWPLLDQNLIEHASKMGIQTMPSFTNCAVDQLIDIFLWMTQQPHDVFASLPMMCTIYKRLAEESARSASPAAVEKIKQHLEANLPFFWFPESSTVDAHSQSFIRGRFIAPSQVVCTGFQPLGYGATSEKKRDSMLSFFGCPVHVLDEVYPCEFVDRYFQRKETCMTCKVVEGGLAHRGLPLGERVEKFPSLYCTCLDECSLNLLTRRRTGIIRRTTGAIEMLSVLQQLAQIAQGNDILNASEDLPENTLTPQQATERFLSIVREFNRMMHRCVTLEEGLWPLNPEDVHVIQHRWLRELSWPIVNRQSSQNRIAQWIKPVGSGAAKKIIWVDTIDVYAKFANAIEASKDVVARQLPVPFPMYPAEMSFSARLDAFDQRVDRFLSQSRDDIMRSCHAYVTNDPAPFMLFESSTLAHHARCLSALVTPSLSFDPVVSDKRTTDLLRQFLQEHLKVLLVSLAIVKKHDETLYYNLAGNGDFNSFLGLQVRLVERLRNRWRLDLSPLYGSHDAEELVAVEEEDVSFKLQEDTTSNRPKQFTLLLNVGMKQKKAIRDACVQLHQTLCDRFLAKLEKEAKEALRNGVDRTIALSSLEEAFNELEDNHQIPRLDEAEIQRVIARSESSASSATAAVGADDTVVANADEESGESTEKFESASSVAKFFQRTQEMKKKQQEVMEERRKLERENQAALNEAEKKQAAAKKQGNKAVAFPLPQTSVSSSKAKPLDEDTSVVDVENATRGVGSASSSALSTTLVPSNGSQSLPTSATVVTSSGPPAVPYVASENESTASTTTMTTATSNMKNQESPQSALPLKSQGSPVVGVNVQQDTTESSGCPVEESTVSKLADHVQKLPNAIVGREGGDDERNVSLHEDNNAHKDHRSSEGESRVVGTRYDEARPYGLAELRRQRDTTVGLSKSEGDTVLTDVDRDMDRGVDFLSTGVPSSHRRASSIALLPLDPTLRSRAPHYTGFSSYSHSALAEDDDGAVLDITGHYEDVLQDIFAVSDDASSTNPAPSEVASIISRGNIAHGRLGEQIALQVLQREFASVATSIEWCNRAHETFFPYDFIIEYPSDSTLPLRRQYVEVKTRVTSAENDHHAHVGQWFISATELAAALDCTRQKNGSGEECYSCLLIHLERYMGEAEAEDTEYRLRHMYFVDDLIRASCHQSHRVKFVVHLSQQHR